MLRDPAVAGLTAPTATASAFTAPRTAPFAVWWPGATLGSGRRPHRILGILGRLLADYSSPSAAGSRSFGPSTTILDRNCAAPRSSTSRCRLPPRARLRCSRVGFAAAGTARARRTRVWGISARLAASRRPRRRQAHARFASFSHRCRISSAAAVAGRAPRGARLHSLPHLS